MIELKEVSLGFPKFKINKLSLKIDAGEIVAITGKNASGKTTILNLIGGIIKPKKGEILVGGKPLKKTDKKIGVVFQNPDNQIIFNKVYDDIAFTLKNNKIDKSEFDERIDYALGEVDMLGFKTSETFNLSAGQKQRIAIAGMLALKPDIILFDEASVFLDTATKQVLYNVFLRLKERGVTVVFATNLVEEIVFADRTLFLDGGEVVAFEESSKLISDLDVFRKRGIFVPLKLELIEKFNLQNKRFDDEIFEEILKKIKK